MARDEALASIEPVREQRCLAAAGRPGNRDVAGGRLREEAVEGGKLVTTADEERGQALDEEFLRLAFLSQRVERGGSLVGMLLDDASP